MEYFSGLGMNMGTLSRLSKAKSRSISPENLTGEPGKGGMATEGTGAVHARYLGQGWKMSPSIDIQPGETFTLADIEGPGAIQHIWMTPTGHWRFSIIRIYWDDEETLEALKELREWDDVKVRYADGRPMMSLKWRHGWQVCSEKCEKKTWVSKHGGSGRRAKGDWIVELDCLMKFDVLLHTWTHKQYILSDTIFIYIV